MFVLSLVAIATLFIGETAAAEFCTNLTETQWDIFSCNLFKAFHINVVIIKDKPSYLVDDYAREVLRDIFDKFGLSIYVMEHTLDYETSFKEFEDLFTWQGEQFDLRPGERVCDYRNYTGDDFHHLPNFHFVIVIAERMSVFDEYLRGSPRPPFQTNRGQFLLVSLEDIYDEDLGVVSAILKRSWREYGLFVFGIMSVCSQGEFYASSTFKRNNTTAPITDLDSWTVMIKLHVEGGECKDKSIIRISDFKGYPFNVLTFEYFPITTKWENMSSVFLRSHHLAEIRKYSPVFGSFGGILLGHVIKYLNFTAVPVDLEDSDLFGFRQQDGAFTGAFAVVIYKRASMSSASHYNIRTSGKVHMLFPVISDRCCVVVPKADQIPKATAILKCYSMSLWVTILGLNVVMGVIWKKLKDWEFEKRKVMRKELPTQYSWPAVMINAWMLMASVPVSIAAPTNPERIFLVACLNFCLIVNSIFQGSLATSYSTTSYYKDIDSMEDLDRSGLKVFTTSVDLHDSIFGDGVSQTPAINSMRHKFDHAKDYTVMKDVALLRDRATLSLRKDFAFANEYFKTRQGHVALHMVNDCPRYFHGSYMIRKDWPFLDSFNILFIRLKSFGISDYWEESIRYSRMLNKVYERLTKATDTSRRQLSLTDLALAYIIFGAGLLISLVAFLVELYANPVYEVRYVT